MCAPARRGVYVTRDGGTADTDWTKVVSGAATDVVQDLQRPQTWFAGMGRTGHYLPSRPEPFGTLGGAAGLGEAGRPVGSPSDVDDIASQSGTSVGAGVTAAGHGLRGPPAGSTTNPAGPGSYEPVARLLSFRPHSCPVRPAATERRAAHSAERR